MRVLYWTPHVLPSIGGTEVMASRLLPALRRRGHQFLVLTSRRRDDDPEVEDVDGVEVRRLPFVRVVADRDVHEIGRLVRRVSEIVESFHPDLVHVQDAGPIGFFHLRTWRHGAVPAVMTVHTPLPEGGDIGGTVLEAMLRTSTWITAVSVSTLADVRRIAPAIAGRSSVIYNGVAAPPLAPSPLPLDPRLLYVGRLADEKGVDLAIRALAEVRSEFPRARLTIAGDGPARKSLAALAEEIGVAGAIAWTGWVPPDAVPALINTASLVIMPSRYREPFGLVAVEAALMQRAVVAARTGGLEEVLADGETGALVPPGDSALLAAAVAGLLRRPDGLRRLGAAARRRALAQFDLETCADAYDALYRRLAGRDAPIVVS